MTWSKTSLGSVKPKLLRTRERGLTCLNLECNRKFATVAKRNSHMHTAHTRLNNNTIEYKSQPYACPKASYKMRYRREGWLTRHTAQCHQSSAEASTPPPTKNKTRMLTIASEFKCPLCTEIRPTRKGMINHCY